MDKHYELPTEEEIVSFLKDRIKDGACPLCGGTRFSLDPVHSFKIPGSSGSIPIVGMMCNRCTNMFFLNAYAIQKSGAPKENGEGV